MKKIKLESVFNEFTLMGIAVSGAFYLGEYWEGIAVILFYSHTVLVQQCLSVRRNISKSEMKAGVSSFRAMSFTW